MNEVKIYVNLTEEDIYKFNKSFFVQTIKPSSLIILALFYLLWIIAPITSLITQSGYILSSILAIFIPILIVCLIIIGFKSSSKKSLSTNKLLQKTQSYIINQDGVKMISESSEGFIQWNEFYKAMETKESFMLFISHQQAYLIPKRFMNNDSEQENFVRACIRNVPAQEKKRKSNKILKMVLGYIALFVIILIIIVLFNQ